jgi:hypothetical protein
MSRDDTEPFSPRWTPDTRRPPADPVVGGVQREVRSMDCGFQSEDRHATAPYDDASLDAVPAPSQRSLSHDLGRHRRHRSRLDHSWRGDSDAGRCPDVERVIRATCYTQHNGKELGPATSCRSLQDPKFHDRCCDPGGPPRPARRFARSRGGAVYTTPQLYSGLASQAGRASTLAAIVFWSLAIPVNVLFAVFCASPGMLSSGLLFRLQPGRPSRFLGVRARSG